MFVSAKENIRNFFGPRNQQEKEQRDRLLLDAGTFVVVTGIFFLFRKQISDYWQRSAENAQLIKKPII